MGTTKKNWQGGDVLMEWHNSKAKASEQEALRNADYASPITQFKSDTWKALEYLVASSFVVIAFVVVAWCGFVIASKAFN